MIENDLVADSRHWMGGNLDDIEIMRIWKSL